MFRKLWFFDSFMQTDRLEDKFRLTYPLPIQSLRQGDFFTSRSHTVLYSQEVGVTVWSIISVARELTISSRAGPVRTWSSRHITHTHTHTHVHTHTHHAEVGRL